MGKMGTKLPGFCLNRIRSHVRVRSPPIQAKQQQNNVVASPATKTDQTVPAENPDHGNNGQENKSGEGGEPKQVSSIIERKIMIVVDSSIEAKAALQWALAQTVQSQDLLVLLHVTKPSKQGTCDESSCKERASKSSEFVNNLKKSCQLKRPEIQIEVAMVEGREKGPLVVEEAKKQGVALLILGQKKRSMTWRMIMMWASNRVNAGGGGGGGVVEYCIQNADCMAIAVRRKGNKQGGGYLITTKRHKDFWLLA